MKPKGINFFERNAEKIVVGVLAACALAVVAHQFIGRSNTVKVGNRELPPDQAYMTVQREAESVQARLRDARVPDGLPSGVPNVAGEIASIMQRPVAPAPALAAPLLPPLALTPLEGASGRDDADAPKFAPLVPPPTSRPVAGVMGGTIDPMVVASTPELASYVPAAQPFDLRAVTVQAEFPAAALVASLEAAPRDPAFQTIPRFYWMNRLEILDVRLERQELTAEGVYAPMVIVPPAPGIFSLRDELTSDLPTAALQSLVNRAREKRVSLVRPRFYPMVAGEAWRPVRVEGLAAGRDESTRLRIESLLRAREQLDKRIEAVERRLSGSVSTGPAPSAGGAVAGVRVTTPTRPQRDSGQSEAERRRAADQSLLSNLRDERAKVDAELQQLGFDGAVGLDAAARRLLDAPVDSIESVESLTLWAHDVTARPGATYRYRVSVGVTNPLFGNTTNVAEQDTEAVALPASYSPVSDWSDPVYVEPTTQMFVTGAAHPGLGASADPAQSPMASVELYHFHYGHWRRALVRLTPGDAIAAELTLPVMPLFTVVKEGEQPARFTGETAAPTSLRVTMDAFIVDVVESSTMEIGGQSRSQWQVVYRDEAGRLMVRTPERDRASAVRRAAEASAAVGETAMVTRPMGWVEGAPGQQQTTEAARPQQAPAGRDEGAQEDTRLRPR